MTSPTRSKEADAVAILRSGGPFAEAVNYRRLQATVIHQDTARLQ
jgi:hypothetical protein